jgi:hypothetical protein
MCSSDEIKKIKKLPFFVSFIGGNIFKIIIFNQGNHGCVLGQLGECIQNYQMPIKYNKLSKRFLKARKYNTIFQRKALQTVPNLGFLV